MANLDKMEKMPKPAEWHFSQLLFNIAKNITEGELSTLKRMYKGNGILQETEVQEITSAFELFSYLRNIQYLSSKNMACLQQMLMLIKRKDLIKKAIGYCQNEQEEEMMRLCKASDEDLEPGHSYVRFHFDHQEPVDFNFNFINYFKIRMSALLFMPIESVIVVGIEANYTTCGPREKPCPGAIITLMMPVLYIDILHETIEDKDKMSAVTLFGITSVELENKIYKFTEDDSVKQECNPMKVHRDLIHTQLLEREKKPEVWSKQLASKDNFSNTGHLDNNYNEKLSRVNQKSGMSITLWKNFGSITEKATLPHISHDELQRQCMHAKVTRIYPQLTYRNEKNAIDSSSESSDQEEAKFKFTKK